MRIKLLSFVAIATMVFFGACSNEDILKETNTEEVRTITLTASMPEDGPDTRVALERDEKNIKLTWQVNDRVQFAIVQGATKVKRVLTLSVNNISNEGKTVSFTITLPTGEGFDQNADFDLYGLYGFESATPEEGGLSTSNPTNVILSRNPGSGSTPGNPSSTLTAVQNRGDVMLYFKETGINLTDKLPESVTFKHLGSLFGISFNNTENPSPTSGITGARLVGVDANGDILTNGNWAFNNDAGGQIFDLVTEQFQDITTNAGNYISFATAGSTWALEQTTTLWAWYPMTGAEWPALRLEMTSALGTLILPSANIKPARATAPVVGMAYHFYARWNGTELNFTDDAFNVTP